MIHKVLDLGKQPIANGFLNEQDFDKEKLYSLVATYNDEDYHFSIQEMVNPEDMFNSNYAYYSSNSTPMVKHFEDIANYLKTYKPKSVMEIGSNDGCFIKHFSTDSVCVEPSSNVAEITKNMGYKTYVEFFGRDIVEKIINNHGKFDLIYSANCICHIPDMDDVFESISKLLTDNGLFVFEDPSLLSMVINNSYDQIYDEHPHIFSILYINELSKRYGMEIKRVENLTVHGGSNRIYVGLSNGLNIHHSIEDNLIREREFGLDKLESIMEFAGRVEQSKNDLVRVLNEFKREGKKIFSYGATSKSTTVFNYCNIGNDMIDLITDNSETKVGKFSPGKHIPVVDRDSVDINEYDVMFLGAWNFKDYIMDKESEWISNGGKVIVHVPKVMVL